MQPCRSCGRSKPQCAGVAYCHACYPPAAACLFGGREFKPARRGRAGGRTHCCLKACGNRLKNRGWPYGRVRQVVA
jgi:hypothetical protein